MAITRNPDARMVLDQIVHDPRYAEVMRVPVFSSPQIALALGSLGLFAVSTIGYFEGLLPIWLAMLGNLTAVYLSFTPVHDSSHRAVSSNAFLNDLVGTVVGQLLLPCINMPAFRAIHMDHHRYVGQEGRDPDTNLVHPPKPMGVFFLMFADLNWVYWYLRYGRKYWSRKVAFYIAVLTVMLVVVHVGLLMSPWWKEFLLLYIVPQRLGLGFVAYTFAHIQHPDGLTWDKEPFQSTVFIGGSSPLRRLLFGQEDHIIHHLVPHVPWFKYKRVWDLANGVLREQGIPSRSWIGVVKDLKLPTEESSRPEVMHVATLRDVTSDVREFTLEAASDRALPAVHAGAHIDVHLGNGLVRQYSLIGADRTHYIIAVKRNDSGRGGSLAMHKLQPGDAVRVGKPRNNFVLYETAPRYLLVCGGIGITPILSMARRLAAIGKPFQLHVCARDTNSVPFAQELTTTPLASHSTVHIDDTNGKSGLDLNTLLASNDGQTMLYLCGPRDFMEWIRTAAVQCGWEKSLIHTESFSGVAVLNPEEKAFTVSLARSRREVSVKRDETIIDALAKTGMDVPFACMQGTCGTCIAPVSEGDIDHRDAYLSEEDKARNDRMCLCVSRARGTSLTLDL